MSEILGSISKVEDDDYQGKDFKKVTLADGQVLKVKGILKAKWGLLQEGKAIKFTMGEYQGKPFVKDIESIAEQLQPAVNPNETKIPQQEVADKAFKEAIEELKKPDPRGDPKNRSYALSYAKDWCGLKLQAGEDLKTADVIRVAKEFAKYLDNG